MSALHTLAAAALRQVDPETAHGLTIRALQMGLGPRASGPEDPILAITFCGLSLPNCVGLAAGFDKNAQVFAPMLAAGFGFVECGTVTPLAQAGNPRPRLFRLSEDKAVINRMGFNNEGLDPFAARLARRRRGVVGANIGANKDSDDRIGDYVTGLRALQTREALHELLGRLGEARDSLPAEGAAPMFLKVAPDLEEAEIAAICDVVADAGLDAVIVSNTTIGRPADLRSSHRGEAGGLSGAPLLTSSTRVLRQFHDAAQGRFPLAGAGGVASGADAYAKIRAGACVVQLYSALVFQGPGLVTRIKRDLAARLRADGFTSTAEAVAAS